MQAGDLLHQLVDIGYSDCLVGRYGGSICIAAAWDSFICILCQSVCLSIYGSLHNAARKWNVHPWFFLSWLVLAVLWPAVLLHFRRISLSGLQGYHRHRLRPSPLRLLPSFPSSLHRNPQSHLILHLVSSSISSHLVYCPSVCVSIPAGLLIPSILCHPTCQNSSGIGPSIISSQAGLGALVRLDVKFLRLGSARETGLQTAVTHSNLLNNYIVFESDLSTT